MNFNFQNSEKGLRLLAAQRQFYKDAKKIKNLALCIAVLAIFTPLIKNWYPQFENGLWLFDILVGLLLAFGLDRLQKQKITKAARIQEEFDTEIYDMKWNSDEAENKVMKEEVIEAAERLSKSEKPGLNWYTSDIDSIQDNSVKTLLCQRENAAWDSRLKKHAANFFIYVALIFLALPLIYALFQTNDFWKLFKDYITPFLPCILLFLQLFYSFNKSAEGLKSVENKIMTLLDGFKNNKTAISADELRVIQNKLFRSRNENTLVPDWLYNWFQNTFDKSTLIASKEIVSDLLKYQ